MRSVTGSSVQPGSPAPGQRSPQRKGAGLRPLDFRLFPAALAAWGAALIAVHVSWERSTGLGWALLLPGMLLGGVLLLLRRGGASGGWRSAVPLHVVLCCVMAGLVVMAAAGSQREAATSGWNDAVEGEAPVHVTLRVSGDAQLLERPGFDGEPRLLADVAVDSALLPGAETAVEIKTSAVLILSVPEGAETQEVVVAGQRYEGLVRATPTEPGERATALIFPFEEEGLTPLPPDRWSEFTARFNSLRAATAEASQPAVGDGSALLPAIVLGDRSLQSRDLHEAMLDSGLSHLSAVSGTHLSLVVGALLGMLRLLRMPRWTTVPVLIIGVVLYVLLVQPQPSVIRAAVMGSLGALAVFAGRGRASFPLLCLCVLILLLYDPWFSMEPAFQLSVVATLGIVLVGQRMKEMLDPYLPSILSGPLALTCSAQLFAVPVLLPLAEGINTYSVPANILAAPLLPFVTVPGTFAALFSTSLPWLATAVLWCAGWAAAGIGMIGRIAAGLPHALAPWPEGWIGGGLVVLYLAASVVLVRLLIRREGLRLRWPETAVMASATGAVLALLLPGQLFLGGPLPEHWRVALCDVGQGDMLVVRTDERSAVVIDAGEEPEAADECLRGLGITVVEVLMISHDHQDHYGGASGVMEGREAERILYSASEGWDAASAMGLDADEFEFIRAEPGGMGTLGEKYPLRFQVWAAFSRSPNPNDNSLVVQFELYETSEASDGSANDPLRLLTTGDLEEEMAASLLRQDQLPEHVDLLKVAHHGAANGGTELLESREPAVALIGVGEGNSYGHPAESIREALDEVGAVTYRTDLHGTVVLSWEEGALRAVQLPS